MSHLATSPLRFYPSWIYRQKVIRKYFSDGISEELLNVLAGVPELRVISRSSAFSFKGKDISPRRDWKDP